MIEKQEHREHKRFAVLDGPVLVDAKQIGMIQNISKGGLLCQCLPSYPHQFADTLSISCPKNHYSLDHIPYKIVRESIEDDFLGNPFYKSCAVRFEEFSEQQASQFQYFMNQYACDVLNKP